MFKKIGMLLEHKPFKSFILTLVLVMGMIAGATHIKMATGNETLVQADKSVYLSNLAMEEDFGGDSILILLEGKSHEDLLSIQHIQALYDIEQQLLNEENILSVLSPSTVIHQMSQKQSEMLIEQVNTLSTGLDEMGVKLTELGEELGSKKIKDPKEIIEKLNGISSLTTVFNDLSVAQTTMSTGIHTLELGLYTVSDGLVTVSTQLNGLATAQSPGQLQTTLATLATNLASSATGLRTMGVNTQSLQTGTAQTAVALTTISGNLSTEVNSMKAGLDEGLSPDQLKEMADNFILMGDKLQSISEGLETLVVKSSMMVASVPRLQSECDFILYEEGQLRSLFEDVVISDTQALMVVKLQGNLGDPEKERLTLWIQDTLDKVELDDLNITISGKTVLDASLRAEMKTSMLMMVGLAVLIMFAVLLLVFNVQWRMLSLAVIFISVLATLGFMGWIQVPVTMVSMAVFPILIGLGIDYSIQFHNRYAEERSVSKTVAHMGKAVAIAVFATVLGFISLYASPVPMIQDFGKMLTLGVIISFIGSLFLLLPILQIGSQNNGFKQLNLHKNEDKHQGWMEKFLSFTTKLVIKVGPVILVVSFLLAGFGFSVDSKVGVETDIESFMPQDLQALTDIHTIRDALDSTDQIVVYLKAPNIVSDTNMQWIEAKTQVLSDDFSTAIVRVKSLSSLIDKLESSVDEEESVKTILSNLPDSQRRLFVNDAYDASVILINTQHLSTQEIQSLLDQLGSELQDAPMSFQITGKSVLDVEMVEGLTSGRIRMTLLGLALVFAALLLIYRNLMKALLPIIPVILIIGFSSGIMYLMGIDFTPITATLGALVLGMGTEMTVMVMERYIEERNLGEAKIEAMITSVTMIGKAIIASGLTTVGGFAVLLFSEFIILKDFGFMTVINISLALLSTFIVLPPLILLFDRWMIKQKPMTQESKGESLY